MRHRKQGRKLNRTGSHRDAMFRNMVTSLFKYERIKTTAAKAKELRIWADNMVTLAKKGDLHARRQALAIIREKAVVHTLFEETVKRYADVSGGYTRVVKLGCRPGDAAKMALVELVDPAARTEKRAKPKKAQSIAAPVTKDEEAKREAVETTAVAEQEAPVEAAPEETAEVEAPTASTDTTVEAVEAEEGEAETGLAESAPEPAEQEAQATKDDADNAPKDGK